MRRLFEIDLKNYKKDGTAFVRPSVRGLIIKEHKIAMVHSLKYDYYKFPGGGIEQKEELTETLIREVREETGLQVIPESVQEYGYVHRIQKDDFEDMFIQDNYYFFCKVEKNMTAQKLDDYEAEEKFTLEYVLPQDAIAVNRNHPHITADLIMIERESRILELLLAEGYFA